MNWNRVSGLNWTYSMTYSNLEGDLFKSNHSNVSKWKEHIRNAMMMMMMMKDLFLSVFFLCVLLFISVIELGFDFEGNVSCLVIFDVCLWRCRMLFDYSRSKISINILEFASVNVYVTLHHILFNIDSFIYWNSKKMR